MVEVGQPESLQVKSAAFRIACAITIDKFEGGATRVVDDGGITRYGIAQKFHPKINVELLTREGAEDVYLSEYWTPFRCDELPPGVGFLTFDMAVNPGQGHAADFLQAELRVEQDGVIGPATLDAARRTPALELIAGLTQRRVLWYADEVRRRPYKLQWFNGWVRRSARGAVYAARMVSAGDGRS